MADRGPLKLANLRLAFACKERWADMVGDDRVRACGGCDRQVFNLSEMTSEEAEAVLAMRGLTPCVRFYRRPDGTVMTADCPTGEKREKRRLAVVASTLAAGATIAGASTALADPAPTASPDAISAAAGSDAAEPPPEPEKIVIDDSRMLMGLPAEPSMGVIYTEPDRPLLEWSTWARLGYGVGSQPPSIAARAIHPPLAETASIWEGALSAELTLPLARHGDVRFGAWGELRTTTGPVVGGELVVEGLPPHPNGTTFAGGGGIVLRAGGGGHVVTGALGFGYVGSWPRYDPWIEFARHVVGVRLVASMNRSLDDPHDWSATFGVELEPIGALGYALGFSH